jgi:hypothetical protein
LRAIAEILRNYGTLASSPVVKAGADVIPFHAIEDLQATADALDDIGLDPPAPVDAYHPFQKPAGEPTPPKGGSGIPS